MLYRLFKTLDHNPGNKGILWQEYNTDIFEADRKRFDVKHYKLRFFCDQAK
jgi:hypothetical protein